MDVYQLLVRVGPKGWTAGRIAEHLEIPAATLSFHLKTLRHAGLIGFRRASRSLIYAADFAAMQSVIGFLTAECCQGVAGSGQHLEIEPGVKS